MADSSSRTRTYRLKPSKQQAVFTAIVGVVILTWAIIDFTRKGKANGFLAVWGLIMAAIVGFNIWAAFSKNGYTDRISVRQDQLEADDTESRENRG